MAILRPPGMRSRLIEEMAFSIAHPYPITAEVKTKDGSVSFKLSLKLKNSKWTLSLLQCVSAVPCMCLCKLERRKNGEVAEAQGRAFLQSIPEEYNVQDFVLLPQVDEPFSPIVNLLVIIFDHYSEGVGHHLNQARLSGTFVDGDVKLVVEGVELPAHRGVLAGCSPVFSRMLTGDTFKEACDGRIEVVDFPKAVIEKFLEYIYLDHIKEWGDMEVELLKLADKYMVPKLRSDCSLRLWGCKSARALEVLHAVGMVEIIPRMLRQRLCGIVADDLRAVLLTPQWKEFDAAYPCVADVLKGSALSLGAVTSIRRQILL